MGGQDLATVARTVLQSLVPLGLVGGLFYYFGYVYATAYYGFFGLDLDLMSLSTESLLRTSAEASFQALIVLLLLAGAGLGLAGLARRLLAGATPRRRRQVTFAVAEVAGAIALIGLAGLRYPQAVDPEVAPYLLGVGLLVLEWCLPPGATVRGTAWRRGLVVGLVLVAAFWLVTVDAADRGRTRAETFSRTVVLRQDLVTVYSTTPLLLQGWGVVRDDLRDGAPPAEGDDRLRYRYTGLVLLDYADGRWFLVPRGMSGERGPVFVVPDQPGSMRVDLVVG